jgi:hypothetical protein
VGVREEGREGNTETITVLHNAQGGGRARGRETDARHPWRRRTAHGRHVQGACHPLGHFREYVVRDGAAGLRRRFGPALVEIWTWANCQSCSSQYTLQFLFKHHSHKTHRLGDN